MIPCDRTEPPDRLPWRSFPFGPNGKVWVKVRYTMAEMRKWYKIWFDLFLEGRANAVLAQEAAHEKDYEKLAQYNETDATIAARIEGIVAAMVMLTWWDPSGDLDTRKRWDALEFAREDEPLEAAGIALVEELVMEGWEPSDITSLGSAVIAEFYRALHKALAPAKEVETLVEVFPQTGEIQT